MKWLWDAAMKRVAEVFGISIDDLRPELTFGEDLKCSFVSDFRRNEFDMIGDDINDVADRNVAKELASGTLVITTVGDYCRHMVRCYEAKPEDVEHVLHIGDK